MAKNSFDIQMMAHAMSLAQRGEGWVNPNPLVGAVIVRDGKIIAEGWHARYGELHAERNAFRNADASGVDCTDATMYVTLEPCCHHGHQPPCTEAIIGHKIRRVVVGLRDPNPLVAGKGMNQLREAGIDAEYLDDEETDAMLRKQNRIFLKYITTGMPWVTAKWAMTLDGKIASASGDSRWVSSPESRKVVHLMRSRHLAIMCGIGTVLADDPMLNVRLDDEKEAYRQPIRIVADHHLRIPLDCQLVRSAREIPVIVVAGANASNADELSKEPVLEEYGVQVWHCSSNQEMMERIGKEKIDSVLLEGGGILNESLLRDGLIDEVCSFIAPKIIGGAGALSPVGGKGIMKMGDAVRLDDISVANVGTDILVSGTVIK